MFITVLMVVSEGGILNDLNLNLVERKLDKPSLVGFEQQLTSFVWLSATDLKAVV